MGCCTSVKMDKIAPENPLCNFVYKQYYTVLLY